MGLKFFTNLKFPLQGISNKYIEWVLPLNQLEFKFNRNTYDLEFTKGRDIDFKTGKVTNPLAFFSKVKYKCKKIDKI